MIGKLYATATAHSVSSAVSCDYAEFEERVIANAPTNVKDASRECMKYLQANLTPPSELVSLIRNWVYKGQDRYGK